MTDTPPDLAARIAVTGRKVQTSFVHPPIPWRAFDWFAWFDGDEPDDDGIMLHGRGETEAEAIKELLENWEAELPE